MIIVAGAIVRVLLVKSVALARARTTRPTRRIVALAMLPVRPVATAERKWIA